MSDELFQTLAKLCFFFLGVYVVLSETFGNLHEPDAGADEDLYDFRMGLHARDDLDGGGPGAKDSDPLCLPLGLLIVIRPVSGVDDLHTMSRLEIPRRCLWMRVATHLAFKIIQPGDIWPLWRVQETFVVQYNVACVVVVLEITVL